jgi:hypothetical protein
LPRLALRLAEPRQHRLCQQREWQFGLGDRLRRAVLLASAIIACDPARGMLMRRGG